MKPPSTFTTFTKRIQDTYFDAVETVTTVCLFSQSDLVPIIGPTVHWFPLRISSSPQSDMRIQLAVSMVLAGPTDLWAFVKGFVWMELHLISFEVRFPRLCSVAYSDVRYRSRTK